MGSLLKFVMLLSATVPNCDFDKITQSIYHTFCMQATLLGHFRLALQYRKQAKMLAECQHYAAARLAIRTRPLHCVTLILTLPRTLTF